MTCNVERYLPDDDSEVPSIERLVHQPHLEAIVLSPGSQRTRHPLSTSKQREAGGVWTTRVNHVADRLQ